MTESVSQTGQARLAVYTGSFDPITLGHLNVIERSATLVDQLIVGIGNNRDKRSLFTPQERKQLVEQILKNRNIINVKVQLFSGLAVDFVKSCGARVMIRGVRPLTDIAAEFTMMIANKKLDPTLETVFLMADDQFAHVSSSLIKQITPVADDQQLAQFIPPEVVPQLRKKIAQNANTP